MTNEDKTPEVDETVPAETDSSAEETTLGAAEPQEPTPAAEGSEPTVSAEDSEPTVAAEAGELTVAVEDSEAESEPGTTEEPVTAKADTDWVRVLAFAVLPVLALLLGATAGYLKWQDSSVRDADAVREASMQVAKDATVRLLSYKPDTVEQDLGSAQELLTGEFRDSYRQLIDDVVIPGSKDKQISAVANVPAVASVSAEPNKAVVLVFVNQTVVVGAGAPTSTTSSVQVTMDLVGDRWLISEFEPV
ncbi:MAG: hypothetical protein WBB07_26085 [Mycobacterium sp.]